MKRFHLFVTVLLLTIVACLSALLAHQEVYVAMWESNVQCAQTYAEHNRKLAIAQEYSFEAVAAARMLATENGILCERDAKMSEMISGFDEENMRLRASLAEAVDKMEAQRLEFEALLDEASHLRYKVAVLERALEMAQKKDED